MSDEVRVGDRYVRGEDKITINAVDDFTADYTLMRESGATWAGRTSLPVPAAWTKAGSGPKVVVLCLHCEVEEAEPGMLFCLGCADLVVAQWAGLSTEEVQDRVEALTLAREIDERDDANRERTGRGEA